MSEEQDSQDPLHDPLLHDVPVIEGLKVLDKVVLRRRISEGGMGVVYRGRHRTFGFDVAVKVMRPKYAVSPEYIERFRREAQVALRITHQNLVRMYDVGHAHGLHFLVMEFVDGESVPKRVARWGHLRQGEAVTMLAGLAGGLAEMHRNGLVHRDIKPENVLITRTGRVKLVDLGLVRVTIDDVGRSQSSSTSVIIGTPQYMAPEHWQSMDVGPEADVWALGATFSFLVTGKHAIGALEVSQVRDLVQTRPFPSLREACPDLRSELLAIHERCMHVDPKQRFANAGQLLSELLPLGLHDEELLREEAFLSGGGATEHCVSTAELAAVEAALDTTQDAAAARAAPPPPAAPPIDAVAATMVVRSTAAPGDERSRRQQQRRRTGLGRAGAALLAVGVLAAATMLVWNGRNKGKVERVPNPPLPDTTQRRDELAALANDARLLVVPRTSWDRNLLVTLGEPPRGIRRVRLVLEPGTEPTRAEVADDPAQWRDAKAGTATLLATQDGAHRLRVFVSDGEVTAEGEARRVEIDTTRPVIAVRSPAPNAAVPRLVELRVEIDSGPASTVSATAKIADNRSVPLRQRDGLWVATVNVPTSVADGQFTVTVTAVDKAEREAEVSHQLKLVTTPPPRPSTLLPLSDVKGTRWHFTNRPELRLRVDTPGGTELRATVAQPDGRPVTIGPPPIIAEAADLTIDLADTGVHRLRITSVNALREESDPLEISIHRHDDPPAVRWLDPAPGLVQAGQVDVNVSVSSPLAKEPVVTIADQPANRVGDSAWAGTGVWTAKVSTNGIGKSVDVVAKDVAGNQSQVLTVVINTALPDLLPTGSGLLMKWIPPGNYGLGEKRDRIVRGGDFRIATTEVSRSQWATVRREKALAPGDHPIANVDLAGMRAFCEELTRLERDRGVISRMQEFRLPTADEWEIACDRQPGSDWGYAEAELQRAAHLFTSSEVNTTGFKAVTFGVPNRVGLYQMHGNASECCLTGDVVTLHGGDYENFKGDARAWEPKQKPVPQTRAGFRPVLVTARGN